MLILLTGGSACGKSTFAEKLATSFSTPRYYLATMRPYGEESLQKILRHQQMRAEKNFITIEKYTKIWEISLEKGATVLLECLCNLTANEMFDSDGSGKNAESSILKGIDYLARLCKNLIIVTNDVGSDHGKYDTLTLDYIDLLGKINIQTAKKADVVVEMCCGLPIFIKGHI